jgi:hypothetical protein
MNKLLIFFIIFTIQNENYGNDSIYFIKIKAEMTVSYMDQKETYTTQIRSNLKDSIWMSFTGFMGIEGGRLLILKDSIYVKNKIDNIFEAMGIKSENQYIPFSLSFEDFKYIFFNYNKSKIGEIFKIKNIEDTLSITEDSMTHRKFIFNANNQIKNFQILNKENLNYCEGFIETFKSISNYKENWGYKRKLRIIKQHENPLEIVFNIEKIELNNPQNMPFSR